MSLPTTRPPRVFISYSHDSSEHKDRVLELCDRLRSHGIDAWIDQYEVSPSEGWPRWCSAQVREADFVLIVCTETYECRFRGLENPGFGFGVIWEGYVVTQELYDAGARSSKFIPIGYLLGSVDQVPDVLRGVTRYDIGSEEGYWRLYRRLTGQPETTAPPVGTLIALPQRQRKTTQFSAIPEPRYEEERIKGLSEALEEAYHQLEEDTTAGRETRVIREEILRLRRDIRDGPRLQAGDFLFDGRFRLIEVLGRGGFATVWKAYDRKRRELVAVKVLHGQHAEDRSRRDRFFRGARKMANLHHPGIVQVVEEHLADEGYHFFVMEYVKGGDLRQAILEGRFSGEDVLPLILAVGEALSFAHERGIIHRDVKPANILLDGSGPRLTDFDLVRATDTTGGTQTQAAMGTFIFAAPEAMSNGEEAGVAADVYSLAMTAVFAYYGNDLPPDVWRNPEVVVWSLPCAFAVKSALLRGISWDLEERTSSIVTLCGELRGGSPGSGPVFVDLSVGEICDQLVLYFAGKPILDSRLRRVYSLLSERILEYLPADRMGLSPIEEKGVLASALITLLKRDPKTRKLVGVILTPPDLELANSESQSSSKKASISARKDKRVRILFLLSASHGSKNTLSRLRSDPEWRTIQEAARRGVYGRKFDFIPMSVARAQDLSWGLLGHEPDIIHFGGFGHHPIVVKRSDGSASPIDGEQLARLFGIFKGGRLRCVVMNAYPSLQVGPIADEVGVAIIRPEGMSDLAAEVFSKHFYEALSFGRTIQEAFELACWQVQVEERWREAPLPQLWGENLELRFVNGQTPSKD